VLSGCDIRWLHLKRNKQFQENIMNVKIEHLEEELRVAQEEEEND